MEFVTLNGVTLHYRVEGDLANQPVLAFANSLGTDFRIWDRVAEGLGGTHALVFYDKRGHGLSDIGHAPYTMEAHVGDLAALLDHLGVQDAVICGLSVGGLIAQGLSAVRPDLVRALVLCDTAHKIGDEAGWNARIDAVGRGGIEVLAEAILERWFSPAFRQTQTAALAGYRNMLVRTTAEGYAGTCAAIRDTDYSGIARAIALPTMCVVGDQDGATTPALVHELASLVPDARYEVIEGAGHLPCIEQPARLVALLRGFFAGLGQAGAT